MASVLVSHEFGLLFEALSEGLKSTNAELCSKCFISATWLVDMLKVLPDTGVRGAARVCLLKHFISIFKSSRDTEDRALSLLALSSFIQDPGKAKIIGKPTYIHLLIFIRAYLTFVFGSINTSNFIVYNHTSAFF